MGSSPIILRRPEATLSSSPFFLTTTAILSEGAGKSTAASLITFLAEQIVSPVARPESFVITPMSPRPISLMSSCLIPLTATSLPIFWLSPVRALKAGVSGVILPARTLTKLILPTKGSAIVLKQIAARGASALHSISMGSPSSVSAISGLALSGEGAE